MDGKGAAAKEYTFGYLYTKIETRMYRYISGVGCIGLSFLSLVLDVTLAISRAMAYLGNEEPLPGPPIELSAFALGRSEGRVLSC